MTNKHYRSTEHKWKKISFRFLRGPNGLTNEGVPRGPRPRRPKNNMYFFGQVGSGDGYKLTLGQFYSIYSTLGDTLSPDPCGGMGRAANMKFSTKWAENNVSVNQINVLHPGTGTKICQMTRIVQTKTFIKEAEEVDARNLHLETWRPGDVEGGGMQVQPSHQLYF